MEERAASERVSARQDWWWIFDPRHSWRARAAVFALSGVAAFTILFTWLAGALLQRQLEAQSGAAFETLAYQITDKLDRALYERVRTLQLGALLGPIRAPDASVDERRRLLESLQESAADLAWVGFADANGKIIAATNRLFEGTDARAQLWFRSAQEGPYAGPLHDYPELTRTLPSAPDAEVGARFLDLSVPVTAANGQFGGVLVAHVRWTTAREVQMSVVPEAAGRQQIGVTLYTAKGEVLLDAGGTAWSSAPERPPLTDSRRSRGWLVEDTAPAGRYLCGYARSRGYKEFRGLGWLTVVRQPVARTLQPVDELRRAIVQWGFLLGSAAVAVAWVAGGRAERRLRSVAASADRIREGDVLSAMPQPRDESELARMCTAVGKLIEHLRTRESALAAENARLSAELRQRESENSARR